MDIIEQFIQGKRLNQNLCEDAIFINNDFVVVVDGVSDKCGEIYGGELGGRFASQSIIKNWASLDSQVSLAQAVEHVSEKLAQETARLSSRLLPRPAACFVAYSRSHQEVWRVGDGHVRIDNQVYLGTKRIDEINKDFRLALVKAQIRQGQSLEQIRSANLGRCLIDALIKSQYVFENVPQSEDELGFAVINGTSVPVEYQEVWPVTAGQEIVLSSDGYWEVPATLEQAEQDLKAGLQQDPLLIQVHQACSPFDPALHSFDDRAWVRLRC